MTQNQDIEIARRFHAATSHSQESVRRSSHSLDWDIKPFPFKVYTDLASLSLPRAVDPLPIPTLRALHDSDATEPVAALTLSSLTTLLFYTAGVTKKLAYPGGGEVLFRAAASTGALYQTEVYVVVGEVSGLDAGLYHFCPGDFALRRLRAGNIRAPLARAAGDPALARRAATVVLSGIYWRNAWKYQARAFRHLFWDSGTMLANLLAVAGALGLNARLRAGFVDDEVNHLLGLDDRREGALEVVVLGPEDRAAPEPGPLPAIAHAYMPLSSSEVEYPLIIETYRASKLATAEDVAAWRSPSEVRSPSGPDAAEGEVTDLPVPAMDGGRALGPTIERRGSTRHFAHTSLDVAELGAALWAASRPVEGDLPPGLIELYLIVNAVDGVTPGAYHYLPERHGLELLRAGEHRDHSSFLCLEQALGGDAAAVIYFLTPLEPILARLGNRGYRAVNLAAGLAGGRAYLAAYALGFGASGLTFYDWDVVEFFSPHAAGRAAIFVTALGRSAGAHRHENLIRSIRRENA